MNGDAMIFSLSTFSERWCFVIFLLPLVNVGSSSSVKDDAMIYSLSTVAQHDSCAFVTVRILG